MRTSRPFVSKSRMLVELISNLAAAMTWLHVAAALPAAFARTATIAPGNQRLSRHCASTARCAFRLASAAVGPDEQPALFQRGEETRDIPRDLVLRSLGKRSLEQGHHVLDAARLRQCAPGCRCHLIQMVNGSRSRRGDEELAAD